MTALKADARQGLGETLDRLLHGGTDRPIAIRPTGVAAGVPVIGAYGNARDGVSRLHRFDASADRAADRAADRTPSDLRRPDLLLVDLAGTTIDAYENLRCLCARAPGARLVVLEERLSIRRLCAALHAGVKGYLLKDTAPDALIQSLSVVLAGETVFPTRLADWLRTSDIVAPDPDAAVERASLSWRDTDLLHGLQSGKSVRGIAEDLHISETEARASLRSLLRRLNLSNRTQAAIWAANNGIRPSPHPPAGRIARV
ncbi:LuxR C-terminal-related transcriptional regulator [Azospirillum rugosum]|uniref:DNA-binding NarL/FixJ family response regulator n=1 Tax=Azospirillum rugosum TaxID=416170 RepID=A0ABS4SME8_9PROT|nr:response regulator transcription factor [Azospirillum rugosum]MBP2293743.1 DNA-binding NarL/FixJ family response regulator [Azospirillum rugosum]MDQ0527288.1 DNA-binding NarL/FixJ family response regulator [Azospirillum rugosum]